MSDNIEIHGYCEPRFNPVKEAFAENFKLGLEVGASFATTINGKYVVDIWAGHFDNTKTRPWEKDTVVNVFSTSKVMAALCTLMLVDQGKLDIDAPVADYWPEFAQAGKEKIPVRYILSHSSGLSSITEPLTLDDYTNWDRIISLLAAQKPQYEPGTETRYHGLTFNFLLGELIRRVSGKSLSTFFREEVAIPLKADFHFGYAEEIKSRVGEMIRPPGQETAIRIPTSSTSSSENRIRNISETTGFGNARSVARVGSLMACGGELDNVRLFSPSMIGKILEEQIDGYDSVLRTRIRRGLGFALKLNPKGSNPNNFWWAGAGGSIVIMNPDLKLCYAYVMNKMSSGLVGDTRVSGIARALYRSI